MHRILVVYGTRPEAIKLAPVIRALELSRHLEPVVVVTGQHRSMLDQVNTLFGIVPAHDLDLIRKRPNLAGITAGVLHGVGKILEEEQPDLVIVQGDTTTVFSAALAAFYAQIPVAHVEAGLRTGDRYDPFPEEINRRLTTALTTLHLAPTDTSRANLVAEGIHSDGIHVTGNTVIDALLDITGRRLPPTDPALVGLDPTRRLVLVTSHRRENWGEPMVRISHAIARLARAFPDVDFVLPAHLNPIVRDSLLPALSGLPNVVVTEPLDYVDMAHALASSYLVITDSGGVQEEAPSLGKPVLVLRDTTERPEAVTAKTVQLVGTDENRIVDSATRLLLDPAAYDAMARAVNPYGDGRAADRIVAAIENFFGEGPRPEVFSPAAP
ncbi:non-hydrolyzing UDP-N-acetylglucosamine 2-epimerase [Cryobacterium mannosilyticum]|uniref:UDP-N-acetylglucosamine 2-epimerase (non-hydrolyzing) n=2 Tax=Cryobacterium TaxID=69578 RepID=A0A4V3ICU2_9MICO|nr:MULTISPECIES: UDP-N-acetylglucosamine 2-epimerase (non-hydrolyzing) [Cryobacterium]TFB91757.1 UDP-N-acetylglucosamine 2-epimerase (non-hydrolyzing) [Cryobacterium sp. HLT2-28]TFC03108.1 UDP-N-acetylglucosamine 2-epimerase (non-hydrolyzing) [Cryobacterium mannosilyticum]